jgi:hypothetical protein
VFDTEADEELELLVAELLEVIFIEYPESNVKHAFEVSQFYDAHSVSKEQKQESIYSPISV